VPFGREEHGDFARTSFQQVQHGLRPGGSKSLCSSMSNSENSIWRTVMHAALEVLGGQHLVEQFARQRLAGVDVGGHALHTFPFPAVVFHELRRQFDGIPFDAVDAGNAQFLAAGQQVVQAVAGFVEQRDHVVVGEGGRFAADRAREVAVEVGNRLLDAAAVAGASGLRPSRRRRAWFRGRRGRGRTGRPVRRPAFRCGRSGRPRARPAPCPA
jgi:hypothetical protein